MDMTTLKIISRYRKYNTSLYLVGTNWQLSITSFSTDAFRNIMVGLAGWKQKSSGFFFALMRL